MANEMEFGDRMQHRYSALPAHATHLHLIGQDPCQASDDPCHYIRSSLSLANLPIMMP